MAQSKAPTVVLGQGKTAYVELMTHMLPSHGEIPILRPTLVLPRSGPKDHWLDPKSATTTTG